MPHSESIREGIAAPQSRNGFSVSLALAIQNMHSYEHPLSSIRHMLATHFAGAALHSILE